VAVFDEFTPAVAQVPGGASLQHLEHRPGEGCRLVRRQRLAPRNHFQPLERRGGGHHWPGRGQPFEHLVLYSSREA
jgi:hypothetical protein